MTDKLCDLLRQILLKIGLDPESFDGDDAQMSIMIDMAEAILNNVVAPIVPAVGLGPAPEATNDINDLIKPAIGDCVKYIDSNRVLCCGTYRYPFAIVVSLDPFVLVSAEADMRWESTVKYSEFKSVGQVSKATLNKCLTRLGG